jgi:YfiR/HmsC-like
MRHAHDTEFSRHSCKGRGTRNTHSSRPWLTAIAMAWWLLAIPVMRAQSPKPTDYDVKAAYLYNFGRFIEWPGRVGPAQGGDGSFTVCVLGQDPFGSSLDTTLAGETIGGKSVVAKRISSPQESGNCQILFLSLTEGRRLDKIIADLDKKAVLTVSDMPQFAERGGMIQFVLDGKKVRFEVNLTAAQNAGLTLSSELLKVATTVRRSSSSGD